MASIVSQDQVLHRARTQERGSDLLDVYADLLTLGQAPDADPGLWASVGRQARSSGAEGMAQQIQMQLWDAGLRSAEIAIDLARDALQRNRPEDAAYFIEETFGASPSDQEAADILLRAYAQFRPEQAVKLWQASPSSDPEQALIAIDSFRATDRLQEARSFTASALAAHPDNVRFAARKARIEEALGEWDDALATWMQIERDAANVSDQTSATAQMVRILVREERHHDAIARAAPLLAGSTGGLDRLRTAELLGLDSLIPAMLEVETSGHARGNRSEMHRIARWLRDRGDLGGLVWLASRRMDMPRKLADALDVWGGAYKGLADGTLHAAMAIRSPEALLPLSRELAQRLRYPVATDTTQQASCLLVNATLGAGGAERQFIVLCQALSSGLFDPSTIHVALFSQAQDRGHAHFAPALREIGVNIHDLSIDPVATGQGDPEIDAWQTLLPKPLRGDLRRLLPLVTALRPPIVHGWQDRASLASGLAGLIAGTPSILMSARNMRPESRGAGDRYARGLFNAILARPGTTLTANAEAGARDYEAWLGRQAGSVVRLRNGLASADYSALPARRKPIWAKFRQDPITVGGVFRLASNKRPELWLRTAAALDKVLPEGATPRVVGSGPLGPRLRALSSELGLGPLHIEAGLTDLSEMYRGLGVLLLMSRIEGTPNVLLEAQACGIAVAACDVGGVRDAVCPSGPGAGLLLPVDVTPEQAAEALAAWLPTTRSPAAAEARRQFVNERFGIGALGQSLRQLYGWSGTAPA